MQHAHTNGKWMFDVSGSRHDISNGNCNSVTTNITIRLNTENHFYGKSIARIETNEVNNGLDKFHYSTEECFANARLIASAPELLNACQNALKTIQTLNKQLIEDGKDGYILIENELREAIKLAVGNNLKVVNNE